MRTPSLVASLLLVAPLAAQLDKNDVVIANTRGKAFQNGIQVLQQRLLDCNKVTAFKSGTLASFTFTNNLVNGGTAYDPIRGAVWFTNGWNLTCADARSGKFLCNRSSLPVTPHRGKLSPFSVNAAGLAFDNRDNALFMADAINGDLYRIQLGSNADPRACVFASKSCEIKKHMPANHWIGGLAIDQIHRRLFVGSQHLTTGARHIYVASLDSWCGKLKDVRLPTRAQWLQGLAFDSQKALLHVTDGAVTEVHRFSFASGALTPVKRCANPSNALEDRYVGLGLMPVRGSTAGKPCSTAPCNACPGTRVATVGDASVGNKHFGIELSGAASNASAAIAALGFGECEKPGVSIGLCAPLSVSLKSLLAAPVALKRGTGPCGSHTTLPVPIPADARLFGLEMSIGFLTVCAASRSVGHGLSACADFRVTR